MGCVVVPERDGSGRRWNGGDAKGAWLRSRDVTGVAASRGKWFRADRRRDGRARARKVGRACWCWLPSLEEALLVREVSWSSPVVGMADQGVAHTVRLGVKEGLCKRTANAKGKEGVMAPGPTRRQVLGARERVTAAARNKKGLWGWETREKRMLTVGSAATTVLSSADGIRLLFPRENIPNFQKSEGENRRRNETGSCPPAALRGGPGGGAILGFPGATAPSCGPRPRLIGRPAIGRGPDLVPACQPRFQSANHLQSPQRPLPSPGTTHH